jgi:hypothetical protein
MGSALRPCRLDVVISLQIDQQALQMRGALISELSRVSAAAIGNNTHDMSSSPSRDSRARRDSESFENH